MGLLKSLSTHEAHPHANRQPAATFAEINDLLPFMLENQHFKRQEARLKCYFSSILISPCAHEGIKAA
jgi:hypothetical protein